MRTVKEVKVKDYILDGKKIYIQSMLNKRSDDIEGSVDQAVELEKAGAILSEPQYRIWKL